MYIMFILWGKSKNQFKCRIIKSSEGGYC